MEAAINAETLNKAGPEEEEEEDDEGEDEKSLVAADVAEAGESESSVAPRRGWVRRSLASSGTHHSTELIEVQVPDIPVITVDCCIQVCDREGTCFLPTYSHPTCLLSY